MCIFVVCGSVCEIERNGNRKMLVSLCLSLFFTRLESVSGDLLPPKGHYSVKENINQCAHSCYCLVRLKFENTDRSKANLTKCLKLILDKVTACKNVISFWF